MSKSWAGLMIAGKIAIIDNDEIKGKMWPKEWKLYYPEGKDGADYGILRLIPQQLKCYNKFKQTAFNFD